MLRLFRTPARTAVRCLGSKSAPEKVAIVGSGNWCVSLLVYP